MIERIYSHHIEYVAVVFEADLNQSNRLALDKPLTVKTEYRRRVACHDLTAKIFNSFLGLNQGVVFRMVSAKDRAWWTELLWHEWCVLNKRARHVLLLGKSATRLSRWGCPGRHRLCLHKNGCLNIIYGWLCEIHSRG